MDEEGIYQFSGNNPVLQRFALVLSSDHFRFDYRCVGSNEADEFLVVNGVATGQRSVCGGAEGSF